MTSAFQGNPPDNSELTGDVICHQLTGLPLISEGGRYLNSVVQKKPAGDVWASPAYTGLKLGEHVASTLVKMSEDMNKGDKQKKVAWAIADLASYGMGMPVAPIAENILEGYRQFHDEHKPVTAMLIPDPESRKRHNK